MKQKFTMLTLAACLLLPASPITAHGCATPCQTRDPVDLYGENARYTILRNGQIVGRQTMDFSRDKGDILVSADMQLAVSLLWITVYEFEYRSTERWRGDQLLKLDVQVREDGQIRKINGSRNGRLFSVTGPDGASSQPGSIFPTNHWNVDVLDTDRVLNTLTGRMNDVQIERAAKEPVMAEGREILANRYVYSGDLDTEVWYDDQGRWVSMRFLAEDGSTIVYQCEKCLGKDS